MADVFLTDDVNKAIRDKIIACGAVPVVTDMFATNAFNLLFSQLLTLLCCTDCLGISGALYGDAQIAPGDTVNLSSFAFGPKNSAPAGYRAAAFDQEDPVRKVDAEEDFTLNSPDAPPSFTVDIPAAALTVNGGWIDSITLANAGSAYSLAINTAVNAEAQPVLVLFTFNGVPGLIEITPLAPPPIP